MFKVMCGNSLSMALLGGATYEFMKCSNCDKGSSTKILLVDGNDDGDDGTTCVNQRRCSLVKAACPAGWQLGDQWGRGHLTSQSCLVRLV